MDYHNKILSVLMFQNLFFDASLMAVVNHVKQTVETAKFDNSIAGMKLFEKWLKLHKVTMNEYSMVVIENTGIYHRLLWAFM